MGGGALRVGVSKYPDYGFTDLFSLNTSSQQLPWLFCLARETQTEKKESPSLIGSYDCIPPS